MDKQLPKERVGQDWHERVGTEKALSWHGFGSPVGLGILAMSLGVTAVLVRVALLGFD